MLARLNRRFATTEFFCTYCAVRKGRQPDRAATPARTAGSSRIGFGTHTGFTRRGSGEQAAVNSAAMASQRKGCAISRFRQEDSRTHSRHARIERAANGVWHCPGTRCRVEPVLPRTRSVRAQCVRNAINPFGARFGMPLVIARFVLDFCALRLQYVSPRSRMFSEVAAEDDCLAIGLRGNNVRFGS